MGNLKVDNTNKQEVKKLLYGNIKKGFGSACVAIYSGLNEGRLQNLVFSGDDNIDNIWDNSVEFYNEVSKSGFFDKIQKRLEEEEKKEAYKKQYSFKTDSEEVGEEDGEKYKNKGVIVNGKKTLKALKEKQKIIKKNQLKKYFNILEISSIKNKEKKNLLKNLKKKILEACLEIKY